MLHYLAFIWDHPADPRAPTISRFLDKVTAGQSQWRVAAYLPTGAVCVRFTGAHNAYRTYELPGCGVVIGRLFDRSYRSGTTPREIRLDHWQAEQLSPDGGRSLVNDYWGHYIAFLHNEARSTMHVLRDPTGGIPCIRVRVPGAYVYGSRPEDCLTFLEDPISINHEYLAGRLAYGAVSRRETGIRQICSVLGGEHIEHRFGQLRDRLDWDPFQVASQCTEVTRTETIDSFRETTMACVHAWTSCHDGIVLCLSGGLDSAIVLACLQSAPSKPRITCFNQYSAGSNTDERRYARLAAARAALELIECERVPSFSLDGLLHVPRLPAPFTFCTALQADHQEFRVAEKHSASAIFTGSAGDELFYQTGFLPTAVDYAFDHPLSRRLFSIAMDDAMAAKLSVWRVLKLAMLHGMLKRPFGIREMYKRRCKALVSPEIRQAALNDPNLFHPAALAAPRLPPGKAIHAYVTLLPTMRPYNPFVADGGPETFSPLYSQPLIELSLRTPLYVLASEGRDRSIARDAFQHDLPREIFLRKTKGGVDEFLDEIISRNIVLIRELLLDGLLVRHGYLDKRLLQQVLAGDPTRVQSYAHEMLAYLDTEAWLRSWSKPSYSLAA